MNVKRRVKVLALVLVVLVWLVGVGVGGGVRSAIAELELTSRGELVVAVVKASSLYPTLNPYLDVIAFEASKTALWNYTLSIDDVRTYFELAKRAMSVNDLEKASHYIGAGLGALCDLIPHERADEALASKIIEKVEANYVEEPFSYLQELSRGRELSAQDFAREYKSVAVSVLEKYSLSPYERVMSDPQLSTMFLGGCALTAVAFAVSLYYRVKYTATKEEVKYEGKE